MDDTPKHRNEIRALEILSNREHRSHIVQVLATIVIENTPSRRSKLAILMELCDGTLGDHLGQKRRNVNDGHIPETDIFEIITQILEGLEFCHSNQIIHRDLKPSNGRPLPMLKSDRSSLFDPEMSLPSSQRVPFEVSSNGLWICKGKGIADLSSRRWGTTCFRAPELMKDGKYSFSSDIWSIGCLIVDIVSTGRRPAFRDDFHVIQLISTGWSESNRAVLHETDNPGLHPDIRTNLNKEINWCFDLKPDRRPSAQELCKAFTEWRRNLLEHDQAMGVN